MGYAPLSLGKLRPPSKPAKQDVARLQALAGIKNKNTRDLLRESIDDAKSIRQIAVSNARIAMEEAFAPKVQSMFHDKFSLDNLVTDDNYFPVRSTYDISPDLSEENVLKTMQDSQFKESVKKLYESYKI